MSIFRVAAVQMVSKDRVSDNLATAKELIQSACQDGAELVLLPENFYLMGMEEEDKLAAREAFGNGPIQTFLAEQSRQYGIWLVGGTAPLAADSPDKIRSSCLLYSPEGEVHSRYDKIHLFDVNADGDEETYQESGTFEAGEEIVVAQTPFANIGMSICYDLRFPELYRKMHTQNVNLITAPSAFTYTTGKQHWQVLLQARAVENLSYVLAANQGGEHVNGRQTWGHSMVVSPWGEVLACVDSGEGIACADIDMDSLEQLRMSFPSLKHRKVPTD